MSYDLSSVKTQHFHIFFWFSTYPVIENVSIIHYVIFYTALLMWKLFSNFQQHFFHNVLCNSIADKYSVFRQKTFLLYTDQLYTRDNIQLSKEPTFKHRKDDTTIRSFNLPKWAHISIWLRNQLNIHSAALFLQ